MSEPGLHKSAGTFPIFRRSAFARAIVTFLLLAVLFWMVAARLEIGWRDTWEMVSSTNPWWYLAAFVTHYATFAFRGARWRLLIINASRGDSNASEVPSYFSLSRIILIGWFVNSVAWFRAGDAYRAYLYARDSGTSFSRSIGIVLADRVIDLFAVASLMLLGIAAMVVQGVVNPPVRLLAAATVFLLLIVAGLFAMSRTRNWLTDRLPGRLSKAYQHFHTGAIGSFGRMPIVAVLGLLSWMCEVGRLYLVVLAVGVQITWGLAVFVPMANGLLAAFPLTPGGLGVVEAGVTGLLQLELLVEAAIAVTIVDRTISYFSVIVTGGFAFLIKLIRPVTGVN